MNRGLSSVFSDWPERALARARESADWLRSDDGATGSGLSQTSASPNRSNQSAAEQGMTGLAPAAGKREPEG